MVSKPQWVESLGQTTHHDMKSPVATRGCNQLLYTISQQLVSIIRYLMERFGRMIFGEKNGSGLECLYILNIYKKHPTFFNAFSFEFSPPEESCGWLQAFVPQPAIWRVSRWKWSNQLGSNIRSHGLFTGWWLNQPPLKNMFGSKMGENLPQVFRVKLL